MKVRIFFIAIAAIAMTCSSNDDNTTPGNGDDVVITGVATEHLYADDDITLNGAGFDPNPANDTIVWGQILENVFYPVEDQKFHVVSAESTRIVIAADDPKGVDGDLIFGYDFGFMVKTKAKSSNFFPVTLKRIFRFQTEYGTINTPIEPGQYFELYGSSFTDNCSMKMTLTRCQSSNASQCSLGEFSRCDCSVVSDVPCDTSWTVSIKNIGLDRATVTIPLSVFGEYHKGCAIDNLTYQTRMKITNGDGKSFEGFVWISYQICK